MAWSQKHANARSDWRHLRRPAPVLARSSLLIGSLGGSSTLAQSARQPGLPLEPRKEKRKKKTYKKRQKNILRDVPLKASSRGFISRFVYYLLSHHAKEVFQPFINYRSRLCSRVTHHCQLLFISLLLSLAFLKRAIKHPFYFPPEASTHVTSRSLNHIFDFSTIRLRFCTRVSFQTGLQSTLDVPAFGTSCLIRSLFEAYTNPISSLYILIVYIHHCSSRFRFRLLLGHCLAFSVLL
ncbi:hypothetical protein TMatcc_004712 [Talaromyces marneffei ATCC 18224]